MWYNQVMRTDYFLDKRPQTANVQESVIGEYVLNQVRLPQLPQHYFPGLKFPNGGGRNEGTGLFTHSLSFVTTNTGKRVTTTRTSLSSGEQEDPGLQPS